MIYYRCKEKEVIYMKQMFGYSVSSAKGHAISIIENSDQYTVWQVKVAYDNLYKDARLSIKTKGVYGDKLRAIYKRKKAMYDLTGDALSTMKV